MKNVIRAFRLPFTTASALPFIFGSVLSPAPFSSSLFWLGLIAVVMGHLSANLMNDYADSKSGADWGDTRSYNFFGGSKLIQEGVLSLRWYLRAASVCFVIALLSVTIVALYLGSPVPLLAATIAILAAWAYSAQPLAFSYHRLGELMIGILFGPVAVAAGYYLQTGVLFDLEVIALSVPFGLLTAAILYANEIPDYADDLRVGKLNLANLLPREKAYLGYLFLSVLALVTIIALVARGLVSPRALIALIAIVPILKAAFVLRDESGNKEALLQSSKLSILVQAAVSLVLISAALS